MHIPDGYISPATALAFYGAAAPFWWQASQRVKRMLTGQMVPLIALFAAFTFTIMMFNIPVPGGTTGHATGAALAAVVVGPWAAVIAVSVALIIQALFFGDGGITAIGANCFDLAIVMPFVSYAVYKVIARNAEPTSRRQVVAAAVAGYVGINAAAFLVAVQLGIQPIFWTEDGRALYSPYELSVAIPALMIPHLTIAGAAEAIATAVGVAYVQRVQPSLLGPRTDVAPEARRSPARSKALITAAAFAILMVAAPVGLLATGDAWGEWGADYLQEDLGYVPSGFEDLSSLWSAPFPDYTLPWMPSDPTFTDEAVAYVLSAVIGVALIFIVVFSFRILARRRAEPPPGAPA